MSTAGILTFLTDFGLGDHYVAVMKAVALQRAPGLTLVDITHDVPPQDIARAAFVLAEAAPWFPAGTVHAVVVDPGVGTERRPLVALVDDQIVLAPDNGVIGGLWARGSVRRAWRLDAPGLGLSQRSATFDGRDLFAPAAASVASALVRPEDCGPSIEPLLLSQPLSQIDDEQAIGRVQTVDGFGNLVSDLRALPGAPAVTIQGCAVRWVRTYGDGHEGEIVALYGSGGWLEIACVNGSAAESLGLGVGAKVSARW